MPNFKKDRSKFKLGSLPMFQGTKSHSSALKQRRERDIIRLEDDQDRPKKDGPSQAELDAWDRAYGEAMQKVKNTIRSKNLDSKSSEAQAMIQAVKDKFAESKPK
tara:strand:- start:138 stop:452 length:315 start_codon:yes stop_codon:yes gene_type:complete